MDKTPGYVTGHLILQKNPAQRIPGQFVNKTNNFSHQQKVIDFIVIFFFSYKYQFMDVYRKLS